MHLLEVLSPFGIKKVLKHVKQYLKKVGPDETYITKVFCGNLKLLLVIENEVVNGYIIVKKEMGKLVVLEASVNKVNEVVKALKEYAYHNGCYEIMFASTRKGWEKKIKAKPIGIIYTIGG